MTANTKTISAETAAETVTVGTHDGVFHGDDAFAVAILSGIVRSKGGIPKVVRSRDPLVLAMCAYVVDVGGVCDHESRFDHHQWRGGESFASRNGGGGGRYASAGLVWETLGAEFVSNARLDAELGIVLSPAQTQRVVALVDHALIQGVDAADCGTAVKGDGMTVSQYISNLNPPACMGRCDDRDSIFAVAVEQAEFILIAAVMAAVDTVVAEAKVAAQLDGGRILVLPEFVPWQAALKSVEQAIEPALSNRASAVELCVFQSPDGGWKVQCVPGDAPFSKKLRTRAAATGEETEGLPVEWAALRDAELAAVTGVTDAVFCHPGRFIAGARTKEGALALARLALKAAGYPED